MTDETQEPGAREGQLSEGEAQQFIDGLYSEKKSLMQDPDFLKLVTGQEIFDAESLRFSAESGSNYAREGHEREERCIAFFIDLLKGTSLLEVISHRGVESTAWVLHHTSNTGIGFLLTKKGESDRYEGYIGSVAGGVGFEYKRSIRMAKDDEDLIRKAEVAKDRALERARKLDEELG